MKPFFYFCIFYSLFSSKNLVFAVSLYKELVEFLPPPLTSEISFAYLIVLDNSQEFFGYFYSNRFYVNNICVFHGLWLLSNYF